MAMGRYIQFSLIDMGHNVTVVGSYMGDEVPWPGGTFKYPKYDFGVDLRLPPVSDFPLDAVLDYFDGVPDIILQAGDVEWLSGKAPYGVKNIIIGTDPHVINYEERLKDADDFWCMQYYYLTKQFPQTHQNYKWLPYGYYPGVHKRTNESHRPWDVVFCGLPYGNRQEFIDEMSSRGYKAKSKLGLIYHEYVEFYNEGKIAFNWSSKRDLPARFWEGLAMGNLVLTNRVEELGYIKDMYGFEEDVHYVAYSDMDEAIAKAEFHLKDPFLLEKIARQGYNKVQPFTYGYHLRRLLEETVESWIQ